MTSSSLYPVPWGSEFTMSCLSFKSLSMLLGYSSAVCMIWFRLQQCSNGIATWCTRWSSVSDSGAECTVQYTEPWNVLNRVHICNLLCRQTAPLAPGHYSTRWTLNHHFLPPTFHSLHLSLVLRNSQTTNQLIKLTNSNIDGNHIVDETLFIPHIATTRHGINQTSNLFEWSWI